MCYDCVSLFGKLLMTGQPVLCCMIFVMLFSQEQSSTGTRIFFWDSTNSTVKMAIKENSDAISDGLHISSFGGSRQ